MIEEALEHYDDSNRMKVIARSSVSVEEVFRLFSRYRGRIVLFHFAGHSGGEGLQFNKNFKDAELGKAIGLAELFRREASEGLLQLVFLNGCSTRSQLELLKETGIPSVISTRHPVDDQRALQFAKQFYRALANADQEQPFKELQTLDDAFKQAVAYLKSLYPLNVQKMERGVAFGFGTEEKEPWVLYSRNPYWTLSFEMAGDSKSFDELLVKQLIEAVQPFLHEDKTVESRIRQRHDEALLLFKRGIMEKSLRYLQEAKKQAEQYECFTLLVDILNLELQHELASLGTIEAPYSHFEGLHREKEVVLEKLALETEAQHIRDLAFILYRTANTQGIERTLKQLMELKSRAFLQQPGKFSSFRAKLFFHHSWGLIHTVENINPTLTFSHHLKALELWDRHPIFKKEYPRLYKLNLFNYLSIRHSYRDYSDFEAVLNKAQEIESRTIVDKTSDFHDTYHYRLLYLMNTGSYEEALSLVEELEEKISDLTRQKYPLRKNKLITLYYNISILLFVIERYDEALEWIQKLRKEIQKSTATRQDIQYFAYILKLLIQFEKGEANQLDYREPYIKKLLRDNDMLSEFDEMVLTHIRRLNKSSLASEDHKLYQAMLRDIESSEKKFKKVRGREEVKLWVKSKLSERKMTDILKEEFGQ
ncbi:MAG: CHAT domain-containing protein [Nitrospira sp.]|nr:CHAT domain-containing protein [Nitrospira sp.]